MEALSSPIIEPRRLQFLLPSPRRAHLVGVAGSGMRALPEVLIGCGWGVSGSNLEPASVGRLAARGVRLFQDHSAEHRPPDAELVIQSDAVRLMFSASRMWCVFQPHKDPEPPASWTNWPKVCKMPTGCWWPRYFAPGRMMYNRGAWPPPTWHERPRPWAPTCRRPLNERCRINRTDRREYMP